MLGYHRAQGCCQICVSQFYKATDLLEVDEATKVHVKRTFRAWHANTRSHSMGKGSRILPSIADAVIPLSSMVSDGLDTVSLPGGGFCCELCPADFLPPPPGLYDSNAGGAAIGVDKTIWDIAKAEDDGVEDDQENVGGSGSEKGQKNAPPTLLLQTQQREGEKGLAGRRQLGFVRSALASANSVATAAFGTLYRPCCDLCSSSSFGKIDYDDTDPPAFTRFLQQKETLALKKKAKGFLSTSASSSFGGAAASAQPPGSSTCGCTLCPQHAVHFSEPVAHPRRDRYHRNLRTDLPVRRDVGQ